MEPQIYSISEAYSMQPTGYTVGYEVKIGGIKRMVHRIESVRVAEDFWYFHVKDYDGDLIATMPSNATNVQYFKKSPPL